MIGLLLKDLFTMRQYGKTMLFMLVFFAVLSSGMDNPAMFFEGFIILLSVMSAITSFSYDSLAKWDRYALSLPVTRREIVGSKYLLSLCLCGSAAVTSFLIASIILQFSPVEGFSLIYHLLSIGALICVALVFSAILLPLIFKFGVEKSRIFMLAIFAAPTAAVIVLDKAGVSLPSNGPPKLLIVALPLIIILIYYLSYQLSVRIFRGKEV
jgi:hypothetical protein